MTTLTKSLNFLKKPWLPELALAITLLLTRAAWIFWVGPNRMESPDIIEYTALAERIISGNFDMGLFRFIRPPGLPVLMASMKILVPGSWELAMFGWNFLFSIATGASLYFFCLDFFSSRACARLALGLYVFHVPLMIFSATISSEPAYLFFAATCLLGFQKTLKHASWPWLITFTASLFLASSFRTTILVALPVFWGWLLIEGIRRDKKCLSFAVVSVILFFTLSAPFGIYNLKKHGVFVISSNGGSFLFLNANSEVGYKDAVLYDKLSEQEQFLVKNFSENGEHFFGPDFSRILLMGQKEKQSAFRDLAFNWIKENPGKFLETKAANFLRLIIPGRSLKHVSFSDWALSFLLALPVYLLCYIGIGAEVLHSRKNGSTRLWLLGFFLINSAALVIFLYTYRYKVYSLEFVYVAYAAAGANWLLEKYRKLSLERRTTKR